MTNEQREAIEFLEFYKQHCLKKEIENMDNYETIHDGDFVSKNLDTVLSLIKEQQAEMEDLKNKSVLIKRYFKKCDLIKQKDKQIQLMSEYMEENMDEHQLDEIYAKQYNCNGMERNWTRGKEKEVEDIKQFFEKLVEKEKIEYADTKRNII